MLLGEYLRMYIFDDNGMRENTTSDVVARLGRVFRNKTFMRSLCKPTNAWLDVSVEEATASIIAYISSME